jgi:hypothetical protein
MPSLPPRLVVVEQAVFQSRGQEPTVAISRFSRFVHTDEQPYIRVKVKVTSAWQPLDHGWIKKASLMHLENTGAVLLVLARLVEGRSYPIAPLRPGATLRLEPNNLDELSIATLEGESTYTITLYPDD